MNLSKENLDKINFSILREFKSTCWISGGSVASIILDEKIDDVDIFFPNEETLKRGEKKMLQMGAERIDSYTLGQKFKLNGKIYDLIHAGRTPEETVSNSDWTACCAAIDKKGYFYCHENFLEHAASKELHFIGNHPTNRELSFKSKTKRLIKYIEKGYKITEKGLLLWLSRIISDQNKLRNKKKMHIIKFNIIKCKINLNK